MRAKSQTQYHSWQDQEAILNPETGEYEVAKPLTQKRQKELEADTYKWKPGSVVESPLFGIGRVVAADPVHTKIHFVDKVRLFITEIVELKPYTGVVPKELAEEKERAPYQHHSNLPLQACLQCGKDFQPDHAGRKYCGLKCSNHAITQGRRRPPIQCPICKVTFFRTQTDQTCCSWKCGHIQGANKRRKVHEKV